MASTQHLNELITAQEDRWRRELMGPQQSGVGYYGRLGGLGMQSAIAAQAQQVRENISRYYDYISAPAPKIAKTLREELQEEINQWLK